MNDKVVVVTGATRGLGLAIARELLTSGYRVIGASRKPSVAFEKLVSRFPQHAAFRHVDLAVTESLHDFAVAVAEEFGVPYGLVNNAALAHDGILGTMHDSQIRDVIGTNVTGTLILTKYICRAMLRAREGRIVNVSSIIASTGFNGLSVYAASKAALIGFTKSLARELGRARITVNTVAPGYMQTDMSSGLNEDQLQQITRRSAMRRLVTTEEVAAAVAYFLSPGAAGTTGSVLTVDAGNTA